MKARAPSVTVPAAIALLSILAGVALRTIEYARNRPLWLDEAMLALNIASRSFAELARPLDYDQTAPILYLWLERLAVSVGGVSEQTLRLVPFVAGVALVPVCWLALRRTVGDTTAAVVALLAAVSQMLVAFSAEAKQYGVDPLVTVALFALAGRAARAPEDRRAWVWLLSAGVLGLMLSQPAVFVLAGLTCGVAMRAGVRRSPVGRRGLAIAAATWVCAFAALHVAFYRTAAASPYLQRFWEGTHLTLTAPDLADRLRWFANAVWIAPTLALRQFAFVWVGAVAWLAGAAVLWRHDRFVAIAIAAPVVLAGVAAALGLYPVMDRLYLFAAPLTFLAYAALVVGLTTAMARRHARVALVVASVALVATATPHHVERLVRPVMFGVGRQVLADVDSMSRGEPVYVAARSFPLWVYYTTDWRSPDVERLRWAARIAAADGPAHNNAPPRGRVRVGEGDSLARAYRGRAELVGLPTGRQYVTSPRVMDPALHPGHYALPLEPDTGWAANEVRRLRVAARPVVWIFGSHMFALDGAEPSLVAELQRVGTRLLMERRQGTTVAYRVEFPALTD